MQSEGGGGVPCLSSGPIRVWGSCATGAPTSSEHQGQEQAPSVLASPFALGRSPATLHLSAPSLVQPRHAPPLPCLRLQSGKVQEGSTTYRKCQAHSSASMGGLCKHRFCPSSGVCLLPPPPTPATLLCTRRKNLCGGHDLPSPSGFQLHLPTGGFRLMAAC